MEFFWWYVGYGVFFMVVLTFCFWAVFSDVIANKKAAKIIKRRAEREAMLEKWDWEILNKAIKDFTPPGGER